MKTARELCESLDWMRINGKLDFEQWENHILADRAEVRREVVEKVRDRLIGNEDNLLKGQVVIHFEALDEILDAIAEGGEK